MKKSISTFERKNIFLDFMSPDNWKTYATFSEKKSDDSKVSILQKSLNIAVLLSKDYCLLPPGFIAQSVLAKKALEQKAAFLEERLILFPLRESNLGDFFEKKQSEYMQVKDSHKGFYKKDGQIFIKKYVGAIIGRQASMGSTIAEQWQSIPDSSKVWSPIIQVAPKLADQIRIAPASLKNQGLSVTLEAVKLTLGIENNYLDFVLNQAIQHEYTKTYLDEYDAVIIRNIPPKPYNINYLVETEWLFYDYYIFSEVLKVIGVNSYIENTNAETIISIRRSPEYFNFMQLYETVCCDKLSRGEVVAYFASIKNIIGSSVKSEFLLDETNPKKQLDTVLQILNAIVELRDDNASANEARKNHQQVSSAYIENAIRLCESEKNDICKKIKNKITVYDNYIENLKKNAGNECKIIGLVTSKCDLLNKLEDKVQEHFTQSISIISNAKSIREIDLLRNELAKELSDCCLEVERNNFV